MASDQDTADCDRKFLRYAKMKRYGGSFVMALSEAMMKADPINYARIENAFPDIMEEYDSLAMKCQSCGSDEVRDNPEDYGMLRCYQCGWEEK